MNTLVPAALALLALATAAPAIAQPEPPQLIDSVQSATVVHTGPDTITVCARGTVVSGGWTFPTLKLTRNVAHGGVYDLDFTALPPTGIHTDMVSEITARFVWRGVPADLRGVRVRGLKAAALATVDTRSDC